MKRASTAAAFVFGGLLATLTLNGVESSSVAQVQKDPPVGRYNLVTAEKGQKFFVDTQTGQVWQFMGENSWQEMRTPIGMKQ